VVIGAGISGLTTAYRLRTLAADQGVTLDVIVLEASGRSGGLIETFVADGFIMERGPDSLITEKPWALELCEELEIADEIIPTRREPRGSFIVSRDKLCPVPEGLHLMAPARIGPFVASPLMSWRGKLRALCDLFIPSRRHESEDRDESLASFVRRRLGREALERLAQPMVGGIYTADPEKLSLAATMPRFIEMEQKFGSVIRGLMSARRKSGVSARGPRYDLFVAHRDGIEAIVARLVEKLGPETIRTRTRVDRVQPTRSVAQTEAPGHSGWEIAMGDETLYADGVCLTAPAYIAASLLDETDHSLAGELAAVEYSSAVTVNLVYPRAAIPHALNGFGFVIPAIENRDIIACTFSSVKYEGRAPDDKVLLRAFIGGALAPEKFELDDREILATVKRELGELIGVTREPEQTLITRWARSMPQYHLGHMARVDRIEEIVASHHGLELAGNAYRGTGIPDCVRYANETAIRLFGQLFPSDDR
jgi:oxygen-dependent protoporphyrinogen oxidase